VGLVASRREAGDELPATIGAESRTQADIQQLKASSKLTVAQVHDLSLPSPIVTPRPEPAAPRRIADQLTPSGARGYEMAIRMARGGRASKKSSRAAGPRARRRDCYARLHCAVAQRLLDICRRDVTRFEKR
jgi:hypothetical protein